MDIETIKRVKGDFNQISNTMKMNSQQSQQGTNKSQSQSEDQTEKTQSLTIQGNNIIDLNLKEIIALYDKIDMRLFSHRFNLKNIYAERYKFDDVSQLENQRIVLHLYKNTLVLAGFIIETNQLVVIKEIQVSAQEALIQNLDEYRIHYKINQLYPQDSLELIIPVQVQKFSNFYEIAACIERAEFNLFDYSRNHQIGEEEAINIFIQILDQIINLHLVNIAHRDIKPQNIFYVKEKGWLLSDFGESLEYENVQDLYNIRGTKYFLIPSLQLNIGKNIKINQNLITNDLYALVVSIIMIKTQQYINDMKEQIINLQDDFLKQLIDFKNLSQLQQFRKKIQFNVNKDLINLSISCQKEMNDVEFRLNQRFNFLFQIQYFQIQLSIDSDPIWLEQIHSLIKKNLKYILKNFYFSLGIALTQLSQYSKIDLHLQLNLKFLKNIIKKSQIQQEFLIKLFFIYGQTENTIFFATEYLKTHYSQEVHLVLIETYFRVGMFKEAEQQMKQFNEGMVFDQLNTDSQDKFLQFLLYLNDHQELKQNYYFDFNIEKELGARGFQESNKSITEFFIQQEQLSNQSNQNNEKFVGGFINHLDQISQDFSVLNLYFFHNFGLFTINLSIDILLLLLQKIYGQNYSQFDTNTKFNILLQIAEISIILNIRKEFRLNLKLIKMSVFFSESWQQTISFKILYQSIQFMEYAFQENYCKFNMNLQMIKFVNQLRKTKYIQFKFYYRYILPYLSYLIKVIQVYQMQHKNKYLVYILQFIIDLAVNFNYHLENYDNYQLSHIQVQCILIDLKNDNRSQILVQSYRNFLDYKTTQVLREKKIEPQNLNIKPSIKKLLKVQQLSRQEIQQIVKREFIYNRYFDF